MDVFSARGEVVFLMPDHDCECDGVTDDGLKSKLVGEERCRWSCKVTKVTEDCNV